MNRDVVYPLSVVRTLALYTQGLTQPLGMIQEVRPGLQTLSEVVERLGCVQIDTLQRVQRSHYLVLWSRVGSYDPNDFDKLVYDPIHRRLFEGWQHAASIIPLADYRYQIPLQQRLRVRPGKWFRDWLTEPGHAELLDHVLERVREEGALRAADFKYDGPKRGSWWDWKPAKVALEHQYAFGELMISDRVNFQRVYDLSERVLPDWVESHPPTVEERDRYWLEHGARALGACTPAQVSDYTFLKRGQARETTRLLLEEGLLVDIQAELMDGKVHTLIVHRDNLSVLERIMEGTIQAERTTFLSAFDSLFWAAGRDQQFWGFRQVLEAYKPADQRIWGYFCLPILHGERLVGRFDPKLERASGVLNLTALYLEPQVELDDELVMGIARAMRSFLEFHRAQELVIERSQPQEFGEKLLAVM